MEQQNNIQSYEEKKPLSRKNLSAQETEADNRNMRLSQATASSM